MANGDGSSGSWRVWILSAALGAAAGGTVPALRPELVRSDPFRGKDAHAMEDRIQAQIDRATNLLRLEMRVNLPPHATRQRIIALEEAMRVIQPGYRPPSNLWHQE